jgi:hypothetical protein
MPHKNINIWNAKHQKDIAAKQFERINDYLKAVALFVAGLVATPLFNQWLAPLLPGPQVDVFRKEMRATAGRRRVHGVHAHFRHCRES